MSDMAGRIKRARKRAGLTQEGVARRAGMSLNGFTDLERGIAGNPHISTLRSIARVLKVPVGDLAEETVSLGFIFTEGDLEARASELPPEQRGVLEQVRPLIAALPEDEGLQLTLRLRYVPDSHTEEADEAVKSWRLEAEFLGT